MDPGPGKESGRATLDGGEGAQRESESQRLGRGREFGRARTSLKTLELWSRK